MGGDGTTNTGYITTNVAQADTKTITIVLDVPFDQPVDLQETGVLSSSTLEEAYDRLNMQIRRVWRKAQSVLTFSTDEGGAGSQGTADNLLGFDDTGNLTEIPNATFALATDNSTDVTLAGTGTYISIAGQVITVDPITESDVSDLGAYIENVTGEPLSDLSDVTITNPVSGEVLAWNGSAWVNDSAGNGDMLSATYDPNGVAGAIGTVQGTHGVLDIKATNEGVVAGNARGEGSVDLQTDRNTAEQVASGSDSVIMGGKDNEASGNLSVVLGGQGNDSTAYMSLTSGRVASTSSNHNGARVFADSSTTAIASRQAQEFTIQASALRLEDGNEAVGKVLTCNHADGSSNWVAPTIIDVRNYGTTGDGTTDDRAKIQDAIDAAELLVDSSNEGAAVGGSGMVVVDLAGGKYAIDSDNLVVSKAIKLQNGTLIATGTWSVDVPILELDAFSDGAIVDSLRLDCGVSADNTDGLCSGITSRGTGSIIQNTKIYHYKEHGIKLLGGYYQRVVNCYIVKWVTTDTNYAVASSRTGNGILIQNARNVISNTTIREAGNSIYCDSSFFLHSIIGCSFMTEGITSPVGDEGNVIISKSSLTGCNFVGCSLEVLNGDDSAGRIAGCHFADAQGSTHGIIINTSNASTTCRGLSVTNSLFTSGFTAPISFVTSGSGSYVDDIDKKIHWVGNIDELGDTVWLDAKFGAGVHVSDKTIITDPVTVATLPASPVAGMRTIVTDATATTFHSVVAGIGSNVVPVFYDGTNWRIG
jgi:hypothetical protein